MSARRPIAATAPSINYLPASVGTTPTLKPWYGCEIKWQWDGHRASGDQQGVLDWDARQGRFVPAHGGV